jgi:hypothetical protein
LTYEAIQAISVVNDPCTSPYGLPVSGLIVPDGRGAAHCSARLSDEGKTPLVGEMGVEEDGGGVTLLLALPPPPHADTAAASNIGTAIFFIGAATTFMAACMPDILVPNRCIRMDAFLCRFKPQQPARK